MIVLSYNGSNTIRRASSDFQTLKVGLNQLNFSEHRGDLKIRGDPPYKCLSVLLKRTSTLQENQREIWPNLCDFFLQFPNVLNGIDLVCS